MDTHEWAAWIVSKRIGVTRFLKNSQWEGEDVGGQFRELPGRPPVFKISAVYQKNLTEG
jgi:hypothetical protein